MCLARLHLRMTVSTSVLSSHERANRYLDLAERSSSSSLVLQECLSASMYSAFQAALGPSVQLLLASEGN